MKKNMIIWSAMLLMVIAFTGCREDDPEFNENFTISSPEVSFSGNTLTFGGERRTVVLDIATEASEGKWKAHCPTDDIWCSFMPDGGTLILTVAENNTHVIRESWIEFVLGNNKKRIIVVQDYLRVLTIPGSSSVTVGATPHREIIPLVTNIAPNQLSASVTNPPNCDWISELVASTTALTFQIARNPSFDNTRDATITVSGEGQTASIVIRQNALSGYPYVIDISSANFSNCYIYEIWDNEHNIKVGELCKEYLHKRPDGAPVASIRMQTVVAYPMANGKIDHTNGFVVENGYFLGWNPDITAATQPYDMIASYMVGEPVTSMPSVIYLDQGASRMSSFDLDVDPQERVYTTLRPYTLRDQRSGPANNQGQTTEDYNYPITKVATQYWITENLRTTRFRDGENIPTNTANADYAYTEGIDVKPSCCVRTEAGTSYLDANATGTALTTKMAVGCLYNFTAIVKQNAVLNVRMSSNDFIPDMIAPTGWKVPRKADFEILRNYSSQSTSSTVFVPELDFSATSDFGNATGFSMRGSQQRGATGGFNSGSTMYASTDYTYTSPSPVGYPQCQHGYYCFRMTAGDANIAATGTNTRGNNVFTVVAGHHVRLIRE